MKNELWVEIRPYVISLAVAAIAFFWGKDIGSGQPRPDEEACAAYVDALEAGAYAWQDYARYLMDPGGWSDALDRSPEMRAATGAEQLREAEEQANRCSLRPRRSGPHDTYDY